MASRKNPDGTVSLFTVDAGASGAEFVISTSGSRRGLTIRDGQHAYQYAEASGT
jgi:hypothetical protein